MEKRQWYNLTTASEKLGRGKNYVSLWLRRHKGEVPEDMIIQSGKVKLISDTGLEWLGKNIKKEGVLVSNKGAFEDKFSILAILKKAHDSILHFSYTRCYLLSERG